MDFDFMYIDSCSAASSSDCLYPVSQIRRSMPHECGGLHGEELFGRTQHAEQTRRRGEVDAFYFGKGNACDRRVYDPV
jgi:hypothetical protein